MEEIFVTKLRINKVRHLENLEIPLSDTERKHLILTGKNGSGKTSVLEGIKIYYDNLFDKKLSDIDIDLWVKNTFLHIIEKKIVEERLANAENKYFKRSATISKSAVDKSYKTMLQQIIDLFPCDLKFNKIVNTTYPTSTFITYFIVKFFESKRLFTPKLSKGPEKIDEKINYQIHENANVNFVRQLVNLRMDLLEAKDLGKTNEVKSIEEWLERFTNILKEIFEDDSIEFVFDRPNFNYNIITKHREVFNLNQLSDGYSSFLAIVTELIMRISSQHYLFRNPNDVQGLVLIDEIENHLHISLQKKILPFLTSFFPKIQFIVTTHSPFVLSSIDNAVIYDLEKQQRIEDLSDYSYQELVETYFGTDQYSDYVKQKLNEYEVLIQKENHTDGDEDKLYEIRKYFRKLPFFLSPELQLKIQSLELYPQNSQV